MKKTVASLAIMAITSSSLFGITTKSLDEGFTHIKTKNNKVNVLNFPFYIKSAQVVSVTPDSFTAKNQDKSIILTPTTIYPTEKADLLVTSRDGDTYVIELSAENKKTTERIFNFTSNKAQRSSSKQMSFETGKIDKDAVSLLKKAAKEESIPGYKMLEVRKQFNTQDMLMQKDYILDGGKYRVEKWFLRNKSSKNKLALEESNFYTNGVLAISFEKPYIEPSQVTVMWLIINKASLED